MNLSGKNVVIYGAGISGLSAYDLVKDHGGKAVIYDDGQDIPHATNSLSVFNDADVIVLSPGITGGKDILLDAKLSGKTVISELELASEFCRAEQIAVTGTNGKTTTTLLIDHIFKYARRSSHAVGNIGTAFSAVADKLDAMETAVIEASSFQLESAVNFSPDIAVLLNITPDHLDRHGDMKRYAAAKANVFLKQSECDKIIYNADDANVAAMTPLMTAEKIPFSLTHPVDGAYLSSGFVCFKGAPVVETDDLDFVGKEFENVLAAVAAAITDGISTYTTASALQSFVRPDFRRKITAEIGGVKIYNDSKATNVYSTLSAVDGTEGDVLLILGGAKNQEDFDSLFKLLGKNVKYIIGVGENAADIAAAAGRADFCNFTTEEDLESAVADAVETAGKYNLENILFSPASKSFDRYKSYEERGRAFDAAVRKLI